MMDTAGKHMYEGAWHYNTCIDPSCPGCATMTRPIHTTKSIAIRPEGKQTVYMMLSLEEVKDLYNFFLENGYVSHEFHQPIHNLIKKLKEFCESR